MATAHFHIHEAHSREDLIAEARNAMVAAGEQWTTMREAVFTELAGYDRPASAYAIADDLSRSRGRRVAPNSIYRILDLFVRHKVAIRVESANAYLASTHPGVDHDCIFLVCSECGDARHIDDVGVSKAIRALAVGNDFQAERPVLEMRGLCRDCA